MSASILRSKCGSWAWLMVRRPDMNVRVAYNLRNVLSIEQKGSVLGITSNSHTEQTPAYDPHELENEEECNRIMQEIQDHANKR